MHPAAHGAIHRNTASLVAMLLLDTIRGGIRKTAILLRADLAPMPYSQSLPRVSRHEPSARITHEQHLHHSRTLHSTACTAITNRAHPLGSIQLP